ncbi:hypothetical protein QBC45DRAFT_428155 [Copromyces sp. CBS 386.78]|nr:hypothetical protein QBC45DRAFT_428155 [Copromyces sp. CBS 386.78]
MAPTWKPSWRFLLTCWCWLEYVFCKRRELAEWWCQELGEGVVDGVFDDKITVAKESGGGAFRADRAMTGWRGTMHWAFVRFGVQAESVARG